MTAACKVIQKFFIPGISCLCAHMKAERRWTNKPSRYTIILCLLISTQTACPQVSGEPISNMSTFVCVNFYLHVCEFQRACCQASGLYLINIPSDLIFEIPNNWILEKLIKVCMRAEGLLTCWLFFIKIPNHLDCECVIRVNWWSTVCLDVCFMSKEEKEQWSISKKSFCTLLLCSTLPFMKCRFVLNITQCVFIVQSYLQCDKSVSFSIVVL